MKNSLTELPGINRGWLRASVNDLAVLERYVAILNFMYEGFPWGQGRTVSGLTTLLSHTSGFIEYFRDDELDTEIVGLVTAIGDGRRRELCGGFWGQAPVSDAADIAAYRIAALMKQHGVKRVFALEPRLEVDCLAIQFYTKLFEHPSLRVRRAVRAGDADLIAVVPRFDTLLTLG